MLSSTAGVGSNYPVAAVRDAFSAATQGTLNVNNGTVRYSAVAKLMSMRQIPDAATGSLATLQTWEVTGTGSVGGVGSATLEVSATLERNDTPLFSYAAFATDTGCQALEFGGDSHTDSYDSASYGGSGAPSTSDFGGDVGTNGNLEGFGSTQLHGTLSSPRTGVGTCSSGNVTALDGNLSQVSGGLISLSQTVPYPTPPTPNPLPPQTSDSFTKAGGCPAGASYCTVSSNGATITPPSASTKVTLGNVSVGNQAELHLAAGIYVVNSLSFGAQGTIIVDGPGPVIFQVAGQNQDTPIDFTGGSFVNSNYDSNKFQIFYGGTGEIKMVGGSGAAGVVYAPQAEVNLIGNSGFYGALIGKTVSDLGNAGVHYDRNLRNGGVTVGNPMLQSFTWKNY